MGTILFSTVHPLFGFETADLRYHLPDKVCQRRFRFLHELLLELTASFGSRADIARRRSACSSEHEVPGTVRVTRKVINGA